MRISHPGRSKTQEVPSVCLWRKGLPIKGPALRPGLAPRTFTKCMDAALAPLRLQGIRVLNYLDDWLILAHSRELVSRHRDIVLGHIHSLGLRSNAKKSVLLPSQRTVFLGVRLDSVQMQARLAPARIPDLTACLARFKLGHHVSVGACRRLLGLMAAASPVLPLGLLHMRPFLWWMKELRLHPIVPATRLIRVSRSCCRPLLMWRDPVFLRSGVRMGAIHRRHMITTDASMTGWGAVFEGRPASGEWKEEFLFWHINCLELRAVFLALKYFLPVLGGYHIIVRTDNMAVNRQGGSRPSSPLVPRQVSLFEGGSRSGSTEPGGRFSVETEAQAGGMDVEPSDGIPDLGSVWQSGGGPLCFSRVISVPALVLPGHRCVCPPMAECQSVRVSANKADSGSTMQSEGERCPSPSHSPILALPDLVLGANSPLVLASLRPRPGYIPKVLSTSFRSQVVTLHSFHPPPFASSEDERLHLLCPVRALKLIVDRSKVWRKSPQLLICFGAGRRGLATSKQRISHWVRDAISLAYEARNLPSPLSLRVHSTRGIASSQALFRGVPLEDICVAAGWSSPHTFVKFYNLDVDTASGSQICLLN